MRACPVCGASNGPTDDFCGNCGTYLGWSDSPRPAAPGPAPGPGPVPEGGPVRPDGGPVPPEPGPVPPPAAEPPADTAAEPPAEAAGEPTGEPAAQPTPEPPAQPPAPQDPVAVRPAKAVAPRPVVRPVAASEPTSGTPCPVCGTLNQPGRRFCRRCAAELHPAAQPEPLPWWRTMWPLRRRVRAGSGRRVRLLVILLVVLALCAAGFLLLPAGRALFEDTKDKLGKPRAVTPVRVAASAEIPGHPAGNTTDELRNRYWGAPAPGASVTYTFRRPFRLVDVAITNGASNDPEEYHGEARALRMDMEVTRENGERQTRRLTLSDKPGFQSFATGISDVVKVRLTLHSPAGLGRGRHLAVAEVEFYERT